MGLGRKAMVYLGLAEEDEGYVDDDYDADEPVRERAPRRVEAREVEAREPAVAAAPAPSAVATPRRGRVERVGAVRADSRSDVRVDHRADHREPGLRVADPRLDTRGSLAPRLAEPVAHEVDEPAPAAYKITTLQPRSYNEARQIGEAFREGIPVIMNLTEMADEDAKRLVDFAAGLIFGLRGSIEKVTNKVFLLSPSNVEVSAEDKRRIAEGGFYNQS